MSGRWKLILNQVSSQLVERPRRELYDLEEDPGERRNVVSLHPGVADRLEARALEIMAAQGHVDPLDDGVTIDPEVLDQLSALGYVGGEEANPDIWKAMASMPRLNNCATTRPPK